MLKNTNFSFVAARMSVYYVLYVCERKAEKVTVTAELLKVTQCVNDSKVKKSILKGIISKVVVDSIRRQFIPKHFPEHFPHIYRNRKKFLFILLSSHFSRLSPFFIERYQLILLFYRTTNNNTRVQRNDKIFSFFL